MMARKNSLLILSFILVLILFDAFQQRYYLTTFNLSVEPVFLSELLKSQLIRWSIWGLIAIPFSFLVWRKLKKVDFSRFSNSLLIFCAAVLSVLISVSIISVVSIISGDQEMSVSTLTEFFIFFCYQKGLTFFMAYGTVAILLNNYSKSKQVRDQKVEIVNLRKTSEELNKTIQLKDSGKEPYLSIKTGHKVKPIPLSQIIWIQADDYCVRIHTEDRSYSLRKSLKILEEQLKPFRFIRVHRGALLNLQYLDQINLDSATIRLQNEAELPLSSTGIKALKKKMKEASL